MLAETILRLSYIVPVVGLISFLYRILILKVLSIDCFWFSLIGIIPLLNILIGLSFFACLLNDISNTKKLLLLSKEERDLRLNDYYL